MLYAPTAAGLRERLTGWITSEGLKQNGLELRHAEGHLSEGEEDAAGAGSDGGDGRRQ